VEFQVLVSDLGQRRDVIATQADSSQSTESREFRGEVRELKKIRVSLSVPIYRLANGRTKVAQLQHIKAQGLPEDFFTFSDENEAAQIAQHEILAKMSKNPKGNIHAELERTRRQTESLLCTDHGVVVNGNRRLASMRELYASDPVKFKSFEHVDLLVLPPETTRQDVESIEASLQMAPETKLAYGWIERRLKLKEHVEVLQFDRAIICQMYRFRDREIDVQLSELALVDEYLSTFLEEPGNYDKASSSEQVFKDLRTHLASEANSPYRELDKYIGFTLIKEAPVLGRRAYEFVKGIKQLRPRYLAERSADVSPTGNGSNVPDVVRTTEDPLAGLEAGDVDPITEATVSYLQDAGNSNEAANALREIKDTIDAEKRGGQIREAALRKTTQAHALLNEVDLTSADPNSFEQVRAQLRAIEESATRLLNQLNQSTS
jgi:hypothetical protein